MTLEERASKLAKDMVYAYEACATMNDLDGVVHAWGKQAKQAIIAAVEAEREACVSILHEEYDSIPDTEIAYRGVPLLNAVKKIRARGEEAQKGKQ